RDVITGKDKNVSRGNFNPQVKEEQLYSYKISRAAKNLKRFNDKFNNGKSEIVDRFSIGERATHMHHIFPKNAFPTIADYIENLIALTSGQHLQKAHPNGNTSEIDLDYQYLCLLGKTENIRKNLFEEAGDPIIYNFSDFMYVLDTGLNTDYFSHLSENDFNSVVSGIEINYS
ncbi:restriction endonuclease, partial [Vibrio parahaemolyticus]|nr:restriction endonuclease [Vibrio parahaemolyticus]